MISKNIECVVLYAQHDEHEHEHDPSKNKNKQTPKQTHTDKTMWKKHINKISQQDKNKIYKTNKKHIQKIHK